MYDLHGVPQGKSPVRINLRFFGVHFEGADLQPEGNPHTVPGWFAHELINTGRALVAPPEPEKPETPPTAPPATPPGTPPVTNRDPAATNRDPRPRGQR